jgi:hypothetical protein
METVLAILLAFGGLTAIGVAGVFGLTLVSRVRTEPQDSKSLRRRVEELERRLGKTEERVAQLARSDEQLLDLEERLEFTERLLQGSRRQEGPPPTD